SVGRRSPPDICFTTPADAALHTLTLHDALPIFEGVSAASISAGFSDDNTGAPTSDFSGTINWGDGNTTSFTSAAVSGSGGSYSRSGAHTSALQSRSGLTGRLHLVRDSSTTDSGS